jgi:DNA-binding transcriptional MerR regulator
MASVEHTKMSIGDLATELGLNPRTIRYYEAIGLLPQPPRSASGYRLYGDDDRERLEFIAKAKALGLTLQQIGVILAIRRSGKPPCRHVVDLFDEKLAAIEEQINSLRRLHQTILTLRSKSAAMTSCDGPICAIFDDDELESGAGSALDLPAGWKQ